MKKRHNAKQEGIIVQLKNTYPNLTLIDHNEYANLWYRKDFEISNENRFFRNIQSKIEQSLIDFHYAFANLPDSYKLKILSGRGFHDFMATLKSSTYITDKKQKQADPNKSLFFMTYDILFNIGIDGLIKTMPSGFQHYLDEQMKPILLLMQSIASFSNQKNTKKVPLVKTPKSMLKKGNTSNLK
ncbi:MAG: hypothetical protein WD717_07250 [Nitrosarchaeum sp.]